MKIRFYFLIAALMAILACGGEKFPLPSAPAGGSNAVDDTTYLQLNPVWDVSTGYDFNEPQDIMVGREPLIYVADTGNDRILMFDLGGTLQGVSQPIKSPVALAQDSRLNLLAVNGTNRIYRINLVAARHQLAEAPIDTVFEEVDNPDRRYTGIAARVTRIGLGFVNDFYVSATGNQTNDNQVLIFPEDFFVEIDINRVNLTPMGFGIQAAAVPSGITTLADGVPDFIFCMIGQNSFKVQWITVGEFGFIPKLNPADGKFDIFGTDKFSMPEDVAVDQEGAIYVVDAEQDYLFKFSSLGKELQSFGDTSEKDIFDRPSGVAIHDQTLYIADTGNNRIVRFKLSTDVANR